MALITEALTIKSTHIQPKDIPAGATHAVWIRFGPDAPLHPGALRIRFADTRLSAVRAYKSAERDQHSVECGWLIIPDYARRDWGFTL